MPKICCLDIVVTLSKVQTPAATWICCAWSPVDGLFGRVDIRLSSQVLHAGQACLQQTNYDSPESMMLSLESIYKFSQRSVVRGKESIFQGPRRPVDLTLLQGFRCRSRKHFLSCPHESLRIHVSIINSYACTRPPARLLARARMTPPS